VTIAAGLIVFATLLLVSSAGSTRRQMTIHQQGRFARSTPNGMSLRCAREADSFYCRGQRPQERKHTKTATLSSKYTSVENGGENEKLAKVVYYPDIMRDYMEKNKREEHQLDLKSSGYLNVVDACGEVICAQRVRWDIDENFLEYFVENRGNIRHLIMLCQSSHINDPFPEDPLLTQSEWKAIQIMPLLLPGMTTRMFTKAVGAAGFRLRGDDIQLLKKWEKKCRKKLRNNKNIPREYLNLAMSQLKHHYDVETRASEYFPLEDNLLNPHGYKDERGIESFPLGPIEYRGPYKEEMERQKVFNTFFNV